MRIDDDDIELHSMDTIDLTGLYTEELRGQRRSAAPAERTQLRARPARLIT